MKLFLKGFGIVVGLLLVALVALFLFFDPNMFKPKIEALAKEQGVNLTLGDLGWTLWPSFGVEVNDVRVAALSAPTESIATLKQASLLIAIKPLFNSEVIVHHILVDGANIDLKVDAQGVGNWEALTAESTATDTPPTTTETTSTPSTPAPESKPETADKKMQLAVEKISVNNSAFHYSDAQSGQSIWVDNIQLAIDKFNLQGQPFDMNISLLTQVSEAGAQTLELNTSLRQQVKLAEDMSTLDLTDGELSVTLNGEQKGEINGKYSLAARDLKDNLAYTGAIDIAEFNLKAVLTTLGIDMVTAENYALTQVALKANITGTKTQAAIDPLTVTLDKTRMNGRIAITDFSTSALEVVLNGDQINVDHYLAPDAPENATPAESTATGDEELIPLDTVKTLNASVQASFKQVTVADMPLKNIEFTLNAKDGLVNISKAQAVAYDGVVGVTGSLDGRGDTAKIAYSGKVDKFQLEPFFKDMELNEKVNFTGAINATSIGTARGVTMNQLMDSLVNETNISGAQVRFFPLNIEEKFCQLVNLINRADAPDKVWEKFTEMEDLSGKITMVDRVVTVESFTAGVEQLMLGTTGTLDLRQEKYDFRLPLKLIPTATATTTANAGTEGQANAAAATSEQGCMIGSNYWLNRSLSLLRCHGSLADLNPVSDCRPDSKALASLTKDFAEFKLREKHGARIDAAEQKVDAKKDELRKKLEEKLGGEAEGKKAEDVLKNLFKKKKDEQ